MVVWMNEYEIHEAAIRFNSDPVLGPAARYLAHFCAEVNAHSDGWPYWRRPAQAAAKLMGLIQGHLRAGMGAYPRLPEPSAADVRKAITPIKAFLTRHETYERGR